MYLIHVHLSQNEHATHIPILTHTTYTPKVFIHGNASAMLWLLVKTTRNDILPKYPTSCNIYDVSVTYYLYQRFWQFESYIYIHVHVHVFWYYFTHAATTLVS